MRKTSFESLKWAVGPSGKPMTKSASAIHKGKELKTYMEVMPEIVKSKAKGIKISEKNHWNLNNIRST